MFESILWIIFVLACVVVSIVILLQEGKGGGLGEAFGGAGQQTFGVKAEGINRFTGYVSALLVVLAIVITKIRSDSSSLQFAETGPPAAPIEQGGPAEPGGAPPAGEAPAPAPAPAQGEQPAPAPAGEPK